MAAACVQTAWNITRHWAREPRYRPRLRARWQARADKLGPDPALSSPLVTFPEAVALAEVITDPDWRHYLATAPARQAGRFYRRVSSRLGEGTYQAPADDDPIIAWAQSCHDSIIAPRYPPVPVSRLPRQLAGRVAGRRRPPRPSSR
jgi:hypothetical protein